MTALLLVLLASPAGAATIWNETVNGDISSNVAAPTPVVFALGGNTILGTVSNLAANPGERDIITFTIPAGRKLSALNLVAYSPDNLSFLSFNAGVTSFVPGAATNANFLAGIHASAADIGSNLMPAFDNLSVTVNSLPAPELPAGTYCFLIQQTSPIIQEYTLEFVVTEVGTPSTPTTWGKVKSLYQ
jgi:hypothetical protein